MNIHAFSLFGSFLGSSSFCYCLFMCLLLYHRNKCKSSWFQISHFRNKISNIIGVTKKRTGHKPVSIILSFNSLCLMYFIKPFFRLKFLLVIIFISFSLYLYMYIPFAFSLRKKSCQRLKAIYQKKRSHPK